ncbi:hypothetical protein PAECIP111802_07481 [Paenibacillus allorhizosphaerae]|uniref:DUF4825 domain-containing protein n=1 Tax=Paenibacillus allorhizosphaerae TaxID=2849866 RepID=A0ABM8VV31_9BACL|nr:hypothetical protein [Paenibacillus allorhizosphaerae]CAG7659214.1 hypothetical protein PAECIP111802_07481 [Paenibacillus allorhizosphaerae]
MNENNLICYLIAVLICLSIFAFIIYPIFFDDTIGPFNVNYISADESDIKIATDLSIGKGTRLLKTLTQENQIYSLFEVDPEGEFGIATFTPTEKKDRFKFKSASYSSNPIQMIINGNESVVVGVRKGTQIHKLIVMRARESVEKSITSEQDFLESLKFHSSQLTDEITVVGYDRAGSEKARTTIKTGTQ